MEIKSVEEFNEVVNNDLVLVDFYANWCGPCKMMGPILENVAATRNNIKIVKVDVDQVQELAMKYSVMSIPTLILFKNGQLVDKKVGFVPEPILNEWISSNQ